MARAKKKTSSVKVNFKGVESRKTPPEGDYILEVLEANSGTSGNGNDQIEFILEIAKGEFKGVKLWFYCPLQENSLWKLHAFLTALGEDVPEDEMDIDLSDLVGKEVVGVLTHETYQGRKRAKMTDFDSVENYKGEDDDKKSSKKKSKKDEDDEDEPKGKKGKKSSKDKDDDDKPSKKKPSKEEPKSKKKKKKTYTTEEVEDMDEDELQELLEEHDLEDEVDLDDYKKLSKKQAAVVKALDEEDLIDDD